jgi:hypothetical protein
MLAKRLLISVAAVLLPAACSSSTDDDDGSSERPDSGGASAGDEAPIVPEGLIVTALAGGNGVLEVIALTLHAGPSGAELHAALRNDGDIPACSAAFSVELFDESGQSLAAGIGGLLTQHFHRLTDGSGAIAACVSPGDVTMAAVTDLPSDLAIDAVDTIVYRCPYFALEVVPIDGLAVEQVKSVARGAGTAYTGTLVNGFDVVVSHPSVTVFPVNRVGRPLGATIGSSADSIPPGGSWDFETKVIDARAADHVAYPAGAFAN